MRSVSQETEIPQDLYEDMSPYYREIACTRVEGHFDYLIKPDNERTEEDVPSFIYDILEEQLEGVPRVFKFFTELVTDKVFLLSEEQFLSLYNNRSVLGSDYHKAQMIDKGWSTETIANAYTKAINISYYEGFHNYWLRAPKVEDCKNGVRERDVFVQIVNNGGNKHSLGPCCDGVGIRPAFYLEDVKEDTFQGDGTIENPFILK